MQDQDNEIQEARTLPKVKAKRKLSKFDFSAKGAAVALVGPEVGGAANGHTVLTMKAVNYSDEFIEKMQQVKVTMEMPEFLQRFFGMYHEDAMTLAMLLGYEMPSKSEMESESEEEEDEYEDEMEKESPEDYIKRKLQSFEIIKAVNAVEDKAAALSALTEEEYLSLLQDQEAVEKAWKKQSIKETSDKRKKTRALKTGDVVKCNFAGAVRLGQVQKVIKQGNVSMPGTDLEADEDTPVLMLKLIKQVNDSEWTYSGGIAAVYAHEVKKSTLKGSQQVQAAVEAVKQVQKARPADTPSAKSNGVTMQNENMTEVDGDIELVAKSTLEAVQKQAEQQQVELQKALQEIEKFRKERQEMQDRSRFAALSDAIKDSEKAQVLFKSFKSLEEADFAATLEVIKSLAIQVEKSELFKEIGVQGEDQKPKNDEPAVVKAIKALQQARK